MGSRLGKAINYTKNQKPYLMNYLLDKRIPISNNFALSEGITYPKLFLKSLKTSGFSRKMCA